MKIISVTFIGAICSFNSAFAQTLESQDPILVNAVQAQARCIQEQARALDDHRSDAGTIADGIMATCNTQIVASERAGLRTAPMTANVSENNASYERTIRNAAIAMVLQLRAAAEKR